MTPRDKISAKWLFIVLGIRSAISKSIANAYFLWRIKFVKYAYESVIKSRNRDLWRIKSKRSRIVVGAFFQSRPLPYESMYFLRVRQLAYFTFFSVRRPIELKRRPGYIQSAFLTAIASRKWKRKNPTPIAVQIWIE